MTHPDLRFRSKIDTWLFAILLPAIFIGPVLSIIGTPHLSLVAMAGLLGFFGVLAMSIVGALCTTAYVVTDTSLIVKCVGLGWNIPLESITKLNPSRNIESAPALSVDRIEVRGAKGTLVLISPADKKGFVRAIQSRVPNVVINSALSSLP